VLFLTGMAGGLYSAHECWPCTCQQHATVTYLDTAHVVRQDVCARVRGTVGTNAAPREASRSAELCAEPGNSATTQAPAMRRYYTFLPFKLRFRSYFTLQRWAGFPRDATLSLPVWRIIGSIHAIVLSLPH
jgi:hypothetical protein